MGLKVTPAPGRAVAGFGLGILRLRLRHDQRLALRNDHRVRGSEVGRERIRSGCHAETESQSTALVNRKRDHIAIRVFSPLLADATCVAAAASQFLPANIPTAPG